MISLDDYLCLLSPHSQSKPRFLALARALLAQAQDMLALMQRGIPEGWQLETALGAQLDGIGALINVPRPTRSIPDEDYRALLRARIASHHWDGTNETLPEALASAFPGKSARLEDNLDGTVTAKHDGSLPFPFAEMFPAPAGIRMKEE